MCNFKIALWIICHDVTKRYISEEVKEKTEIENVFLNTLKSITSCKAKR